MEALGASDESAGVLSRVIGDSSHGLKVSNWKEVHVGFTVKVDKCGVSVIDETEDVADTGFVGAGRDTGVLFDNVGIVFRTKGMGLHLHLPMVAI